MEPEQGERRSPGRVSSTCFEVRQAGQWLRKVPGAGGTFRPQASQTKPSLRGMKFLLTGRDSLIAPFPERV